MNEKIVEKLQEEYPELFVHFIDQVNSKKWKSHKKIGDLNNKELEQFNLRRSYPFEIILDIEDPKNLQKILKKLEELKWDYELFESGSRGHHIHLVFTNMQYLGRDVREEIRKIIINDFKTDIRLAKESQWIAVPERPHFKTNKLKKLIEIKDFDDTIDDLSIWNDLPKEIVEKAISNVEARKINEENYSNSLNFTDFDKDPFLQYVLNNKIIDGERNDVLFKNLAIGLVKSGKSRKDIFIIARKIVDNCPGKEIGEFLGWVTKASKGELTEFNKSELNNWADKYNHNVERYQLVSEFGLDKPNPNNFMPLSLKELFSKEFPDVKWFVKGFMSDKTITMFYGNPMAYKSWCAMHLALCIATAKPLFDKFETNNGRVLYLDNESDDREAKRRLNLLINGMNLSEEEKEEATKNLFYSNPGFMISDKHGNCNKNLELIEDFIKQNRIDLVIIDSYREFTSHEENESTPNSAFLNGIKQIVKRNGVSFVFIHHKGKEGENGRFTSNLYKARGSSQITASMRSMVSFSYKSEGLFEVEHTKSNIGEKEKKFQVIAEWDNQQDSLKLIYNNEVKNKLKSYIADECAEKIMEFANKNNNFKRKQLLAYLDKEYAGKFKGNTITNALKKLFDEKKLDKPKSGYYALIN